MSMINSSSHYESYVCIPISNSYAETLMDKSRYLEKTILRSSIDESKM